MLSRQKKRKIMYLRTFIFFNELNGSEIRIFIIGTVQPLNRIKEC